MTQDSHTIRRALDQHTGISVHIMGVVGYYRESATPSHRTDPDAPHELWACLRAQLRPTQTPADRDGIKWRWTTPDEAINLTIDNSTRLRIAHGFQRRPTPYVDTRLQRLLTAGRLPGLRRRR